MVAITSLGIGSNADLNTLVTQLVAAERQPLQAMRQAAAGLQTQISSYGKLTSLVSTLQTAASKLASGTLWSQTRVTSSDDAAVTAVGGSAATAGSYSVTVGQLASAQTVAAAASLPDAAQPVGSGRLTIELGSWDRPPMNFVPQVGRSAVTVDVADGDDLTDLRDKINAAGAGVTATLVTDSSGVRLALRGSATGEANGFRVQATDDDGSPADAAGLSRFAFDPAAGTTAMTLRTDALNASAEVNGIAVESATNELGGAIEGVTLTLRKAGGSPAQIDVGKDTEAVRAAVQGFADAYNALATAIAEQTRYDASTRTGGPLQGDSAVGSLQRQLRGTLNVASTLSPAFQRLSDIGLQAQRDGTLRVDATKLSSALTKLPELQKALAHSDRETPANNGIARRFADLASNVLASDGTLTTRTQGLQRLLTRNSDDQARLNDRVDRFQQRMIAQYTALDSNLARMNSLSSSLTQQLDRLSRSGDS